jgi:SAM-dependent methyltransferase
VAWFEVRGWAVSLAGHPVTVVLRAGGHDLRALTPDAERPDVAGFFGLDPRRGACGFTARIDRAELPARPLVWLQALLEVRTPRGVRRHRLAVVPVRPGAGRERQVPRAAYREVWNSVSASHTNAKIAVAGYADPEEYDRTGEQSAQYIVREAGVKPTDVVLEIGCGTGRIGVKLAPRCGRWIGTDVSDNMLEHARRTLAGQANVELRRLNGYDLGGIADESVDVVYCTVVFMHLDEWDRYRYVREAFRVLRPGGRVLFDNMNLLGSHGWALFEEHGRIEPLQRPPNISKSSTPDELRAYAERAGFVDVRVLPDSLFVTAVGTKPAQPLAAGA